MRKNEHPFADFHFCPKCGSPRFEEHDFKSKRCADCGFVYYFNPSAATVAFIVNAQNELLVCRRAKEPAKGTLDLPGGFCDCFETAETGVAREVLEETGLRVVRSHYLFSQPDQYLYSNFLVHTVDVFFRCEVDNFSPLSAHDDVAAVQWLPLHAVQPEQFGLASVRIGVEKWLQSQSNQ